MHVIVRHGPLNEYRKQVEVFIAPTSDQAPEKVGNLFLTLDQWVRLRGALHEAGRAFVLDGKATPMYFTFEEIED